MAITASDFPIVGFITNGDQANVWNLNNGENLHLLLSADGRTLLRKTGGSAHYLIHNANSSNFKKIESHMGVSIPDVAAVVIGSRLGMSQNARVEVHLLEFDEKNARLGTTVVPANCRVVYVPEPSVRSIVVTLRLVGVGELEVHEVEFRAVSGRRTLRAGVHSLANGDNAIASNAVFAEMTKNLKNQLAQLVYEGKRLEASMDDFAPYLDVAAANVRNHETSKSAHAQSQSLVRSLLIEMAASLPESNGSQFFSRRFPYHLAIVTDEYMYNFYKDSFEKVTYIRPDLIEEILEEGFDVLLYVTCWKGLKNDEWRGVKYRASPRNALERALDYARENNRPTVFQSIEDPSNFDYFLPIAEKFDYVFTSDSESIDRYKRELGHDGVAYLEYGANPFLNNPVGSRKHTINRAFFAGSYPERYPERCEDMHIVLDSILNSGGELTIADRNNGAEGLEFPAQYRPYCVAPIPHALLQRVHKLFRYNLNFNSIKTSPTMCAMRVYELQAQGKGILSNYALSVYNRFPDMRILAHPEDLGRYFLSDVEESELRANEKFIRNVLTDRTSFDIAAKILRAIGLSTDAVDLERGVTVIGDFRSEAVQQSFARQNYPFLQQIDVGDGVTIQNVAHVETPYFTFFSPEVEYGPNFVTDRVNAFKYVNVGYVSQVPPQAKDEPHDFTDGWPVRHFALFATDRIAPTAAFSMPRSGSQPLGYALPPYEARSKVVLEAGSGVQASTPTLSVIVPIYNNGRFLTAKCFPSIQRNTGWRDYEIILVDDGSTDGITEQTARELAGTYANVMFYSYDDGGSGSASRPRNKGAELAQAPLIAYLDPDNEISDGGFDRLLGLYAQCKQNGESIGFVAGYQVKVSDKVTVSGRHTAEDLAIVGNLRSHFFERGRFPVLSTQAAVIDRSLFDDGTLSFVEGAAGQDTLFGWELLLKSKSGAFTSSVHLLYYAERSDSVTNTVDVEYFEKKVLMEEAQVKALKRHGLYDLYVEHHFADFMRGWYMKKLSQVSPDARRKAEAMIDKIATAYGARLDDFR